MKIEFLSLFLVVASTKTSNAFLPLANLERKTALSLLKDDQENKVVRIPLGKKERYVRPAPSNDPPTLGQLQQEYQNLKDHLRHNLFELKQKQCQVAQEEDALLQEAMHEVEFERFAQEMDVLANLEDYADARSAVEEAQMDKKLAVQKWAQDQAAWMDSELNDLQTRIQLEESSEDLSQRSSVLNQRLQAEERAFRKEERAEAMLEFLEDQEASLHEISHDPKKEQLWVQEELNSHHQSLLKVALLELETEQLWDQLRDDLLDLKRQQLLVDKQEEMLAAKEADIVALQAQEEKVHVQSVLEAMKRTHEEVKKAVALKEQAYRDTLDAVVIGDEDPTELWLLSEAAQEANEANAAADAGKELLNRLHEEEVQAEDLLHLLEQKGAILKELRLPGHEEALQEWVKDELSHHESMLNVVKDNIFPRDLLDL